MQKYKILIAIIISIFINGIFYFNRQNLYNDLTKSGQLAQVYYTFLSSKSTPWHFGGPAKKYYFVSSGKDTIWGMEKLPREVNIDLKVYIKGDSVLYLPQNPKKYMFVDDINSFSHKNSLFAFGIGTIVFLPALFVFYKIFQAIVKTIHIWRTGNK